LVLSGCFAWALGQVMIRKLKDVSGMQVTAWIAVFAAPQLFFMSAVFEDGQVEAIRTANPLVWWTVLYLGLIMTCLGYYFWNTLIRHHDVSKVAPFLLLLPVFSVLGGNVFLGETITLEKFYGGATILFGIGVITMNARLSSVFSRR
jgi:drug/metabolite transporter (DMT)-like permease